MEWRFQVVQKAQMETAKADLCEVGECKGDRFQRNYVVPAKQKVRFVRVTVLYSVLAHLPREGKKKTIPPCYQYQRRQWDVVPQKCLYRELRKKAINFLGTHVLNSKILQQLELEKGKHFRSLKNVHELKARFVLPYSPFLFRSLRAFLTALWVQN